MTAVTKVTVTPPVRTPPSRDAVTRLEAELKAVRAELADTQRRLAVVEKTLGLV